MESATACHKRASLPLTRMSIALAETMHYSMAGPPPENSQGIAPDEPPQLWDAHHSLAWACMGVGAAMAGMMPQSLIAWSRLSTSSSLWAAERLILNLCSQVCCHQSAQKP